MLFVSDTNLTASWYTRRMYGTVRVRLGLGLEVRVRVSVRVSVRG